MGACWQTQEQFAGAEKAFLRLAVLRPSGTLKAELSSLLPRQRPTCPKRSKINEQMSGPLPSRSGDKTELSVVGMSHRWAKKVEARFVENIC